MTSFDLKPIPELENTGKPSWKFKPADTSKFEVVEPGKYRYPVQSGNTPKDIFLKAQLIAWKNDMELTARNYQELLKENNLGKSFRVGQVLIFQTRPKDGGSPALQIPTQDTYVPSRPAQQAAPQAAPKAAQQAAPPKPALATGPLSAEQKKEFYRIIYDPKASKPEKAAAIMTLKIDIARKDPRTLNVDEANIHLQIRTNPAYAKKLGEIGIKPINKDTFEGKQEIRTISAAAVANTLENASGAALDYLNKNPGIVINKPKDLHKLYKLDLGAKGKLQANCHVYAKTYKMLYEAAGLKTQIYASTVSIPGEMIGHANVVGYSGNSMIINNNHRVELVNSNFDNKKAMEHIKDMIYSDFNKIGVSSSVRSIDPAKSFDQVKTINVSKSDKNANTDMAESIAVDCLNLRNQISAVGINNKNATNTKAFIEDNRKFIKNNEGNFAGSRYTFKQLSMDSLKWCENNLPVLSGKLSALESLAKSLPDGKRIDIDFSLRIGNKTERYHFKTKEDLLRFIKREQDFIARSSNQIAFHKANLSKMA